MKVRHKILLVLICLFLGIQFYRPNKNEYKNITLDDLLLYNKAPEHIKNLFINSCYDCHSNQIKSYWYSNIMPVAWLIDKDIKEARAVLNFSEWETYSQDEKIELASKILYQVVERKMPLDNYLLLHKEADLTKKERNELTQWLNSILE